MPGLNNLIKRKGYLTEQRAKPQLTLSTRKNPTLNKTKTQIGSSLVAQLVKNPPAMQETPEFDLWAGKIP